MIVKIIAEFLTERLILAKQWTTVYLGIQRRRTLRRLSCGAVFDQSFTELFGPTPRGNAMQSQDGANFHAHYPDLQAPNAAGLGQRYLVGFGRRVPKIQCSDVFVYGGAGLDHVVGVAGDDSLDAR